MAIIIAILCVWSGYSKFTQARVVYEGEGVEVREEPRQSKLKMETFNHKGYSITPVASFMIEAKVLSAKHYAPINHEGTLSPVDLALGWGPMSDNSVLRDINIRQSKRWYRYNYQMPPPIPKPQIIKHSSNMHLIPANPEVAKKIKKAKRGELVAFSGYLVKIKNEDGWYWNSSTSRTDSGNGACELIWVESFENI